MGDARRAGRPGAGRPWARALLLAAASAGCAGAPPPPPPPVKPRPAAVESLSPVIQSPAHWDYHPPAPDSAIRSARIGERGCLITAEGGQRWLSAGVPEHALAGEDRVGVRRCEGKAEASSFLAPEELMGIVRRGESSWLFVGESGALYLASEPLGAFTRTIAPPEPFTKVSGAGSFVLGQRLQGRLGARLRPHALRGQHLHASARPEPAGHRVRRRA